MRRALLVVLLGALVGSGHALTAPAPLRISSISPAVADRGELVTISGGGFGAHNLRVTVGGDPVELVSATGSRASFRVPRLGAVGDVVVVARNPGGITGRIGLRVRFDGNTVAVVDEAAAVSVPVGGGGGTIAVAGMTLAIPAGAVPEGTEITATPLRSLTGSPFAAAPVGVKLEPSGLVLLKPATLTLPRPAGTGILAGFGFNGDGVGFRLVPHTVVGETVQLQVWHFSGAGVLTARLDELEAVLGYEPTPAHERAEQRIADAIAQGLPPADTEVLIRRALLDWYQRSVRPGLQLAATGPVGNFELAFGEWQAWLAYLSLYSSSSWTVEIDEASSLALQAAGAQAGRILDLCTGSSGVPFTPFRNLTRIAAAVELASIPLEQMLAPDGRQLPSGTNLTGACVHVELLSATHAPALARNRDNRLTVTTEAVFWNGSPRHDLPMRFELADASDGALVPLRNATTSTGSWQTTIRPTTLGERRLDLTAELSTSSGVDLSSTAAGRRFTVVVRERLDLQARRAIDTAFTDNPGAVAAGDTVTLRIRLAGDNTDNQIVTLTHDGNGTLPATATTTASGEAIVTYTAPASPGSELVTATITDAGLTTGDALVLTTEEPVLVTVSPATVTLQPGQSRQFTATVTGTTSTAVAWSASGGTISSTGLYTAGSTPGDFSVTARTTATSPAVVGGATVRILRPASIAGFYRGTCTRLDVDPPFTASMPATSFFTIGDAALIMNPPGPAGTFALLLHGTPECRSFSPSGGCGWLLTGLSSSGGPFSTSQSCPGFPFVGSFIQGSVADGSLTFTMSHPDGEGAHVALDRFELTKLP